MIYDLIIIGGGSAGLVAAKFAKGLGKRVAIVEKDKLGGDCTHFGCVPSKALLKSAHVAADLKNAEKYGLSIDDSTLDTSNVLSHIKNIIAGVYTGETPEVFREEGIDIIPGYASFMNDYQIDVSGRVYESEKFVIATGSSPFIPDIKGLSDIDYLTNETIFSMDKLPESLLAIGGGPIGVELASAMSSLGVDVALVERSANILPKEDAELTSLLKEKLKDDCLKILNNTKVLEIEDMGNFIRAKTEGEVDEISAEKVLVAVGRRANLDGLKLEKTSVKRDSKGILVDEYLRTAAKNIYACGDVVPPYQFTHVADYEAVIAVRNAFLPFRQKRDYSSVSWATYTEPELARGGLTESEAVSRFGKDNVRVFKYKYEHVDRGITDSNTLGLAKYITNKKGKLVGIHILGSRAGEVIHEPMLAMKNGIPFHKIKDMIHIYPTYSYVVRQPSKYAAIEMILDNPLVKLLKRFRK